MESLNTVLHAARTDVASLFDAYDSHALSRWQLKMAIKERLNPKPIASSASQQRMLLLLLAHNIDPLEIRRVMLGSTHVEGFDVAYERNIIRITFRGETVEFDRDDGTYLDLLGIDHSAPSVAPQPPPKRPRLTNGTPFY